MQPIPTAVELFADYPTLVLFVGLLMRAGLAWQKELSWYEYRTLHGVRRLLFPVLDRYVPVVSFVNRKGGRDDAELLSIEQTDVRDTVSILRNAGGSLHLLSSIKRRPGDHGDPLTRAHVVWTHSDGKQTEAYLFANDDGTTDVYTHFEDSVTDPEGHLTDEQTDGDPRGVVREGLGES